MDKIIITPEDEDFLAGVAYEKLEKNEPFTASSALVFPFETILVDEETGLKSIGVFKITEENMINFKLYVASSTQQGEKRDFVLQFLFDVRKHKIPITHDWLRLKMNLDLDYHYTEKLQVADEKTKQTYQILATDVFVFTMLFFYVLENYKEYEIITEKEVSTLKTKTSKASKNKRPRKSVVKVVHKVMRISHDEEKQETIRKKIKRQWRVSEFTRRGHWRTYKSGKRVWVSPTIVHTNAETNEKSDKEYRL